MFMVEISTQNLLKNKDNWNKKKQTYHHIEPRPRPPGFGLLSNAVHVVHTNAKNINK